MSEITKTKKQSRKEAKLAKNRELKLTFGEQDALDIMSYAGLEENSDYLCIDGVYIRTLFISGYPFVAASGWLDSLINFNHDTDISYHIHEVNALSALPKLNRKITELESTKRAMLRDGKIVGSEIIDPLDSRRLGNHRPVGFRHRTARQNPARAGKAVPDVHLRGDSG